MGFGCTHAWQVGCATGTSDDDLDPAAFGLFGILEQQIRSFYDKSKLVKYFKENPITE